MNKKKIIAFALVGLTTAGLVPSSAFAFTSSTSSHSIGGYDQSEYSSRLGQKIQNWLVNQSTAHLKDESWLSSYGIQVAATVTPSSDPCAIDTFSISSPSDNGDSLVYNITETGKIYKMMGGETPVYVSTSVTIPKPSDYGGSGGTIITPPVVIQQTVTDVYNQFNAIKDKIVTTANTTADDIKNSVVVTNPSISVSVAAPTIIPSSDQAEGRFQTTVTITDGSNTNAVAIDRPISKLAQTAITAKNIITMTLPAIAATNNTTQYELETYFRNLVDTKAVTVTVSNFSKTLASETNNGTVGGIVNLSDTVGNYATVNLNLQIKTMDQSLQTVKQLFQNYTSTFEANNSVTEANILSGVKITNQNISAEAHITSRVNSTDVAEGNLVGYVLIHSSGATERVDFNRVIPKLYLTASTASVKIKDALKGIKAVNDNNVTYNAILDASKACVDNMTTVSISNYKVVPATEIAMGSIQGVVNITDKAGNKATVPINIVIDYLHQSIQTVAGLYANASKTYIPTNTTVAQDITSMISITNKDISVTPDSFKLIPATDESTGKVSTNLTIKEGSNSVVQPIQMVIQNSPQELSTALAEIQKYLASVKVDNSTDTDQLLINMNTAITNPGIFCSYSNQAGEIISKVNSTEDTDGYIKGALLLADSANHKVKVPVNLIISKMPQSLDNAEQKVKEIINAMAVNNNTSEADVLFQLQNAVSGSITVKIDNFKVNQADELTKGSLSGTIQISDGTSSKSVELNKIIDLSAQTLDTVYTLIDQKIKSMTLINSSTAGDLKTALLPCVTGAAGNKIGIDVQEFKIVQATMDNPGYAEGKILMWDSNAGIKYLPFKVDIKQLPQSIDNACDKLNQILNNYAVDNSITKDSLSSDIQKALTHAEGSNVTITVTEFTLDKATEEKPGTLSSVITVTNGTESKQIPFNKVITQIPQSVETAKTNIKASLDSFTATNDTTEEDVLSKVKLNVSNKDLIIKFGTADVEKFNIQKATKENPGKITGEIIVSNQAGDSVAVPVSLNIDKLPQTVDDVKTNAQISLDNIKVTNNTTEQDIIDAAKSGITNPDITIKFKPEDPFKKDDATTEKNGTITGTLVITDGTNTQELPINLVIDKLPQTIEEAQQNIQASLSKFKATNDTTEQDVLNNVKLNVQNESISINFGTADAEKFNIQKATKENPGKITGTIIVSNQAGTSVTVPVSLDIDKLQQSVDEAKQNAQDSIGKITPSNDTTEKDIIDAAKGGITNPDITVIFKPEDPFKKDNATTEKDGTITGTLVISDGKTTQEIPINIVIPKLPSTYVPSTYVPSTYVPSVPSTGGSSSSSGGSSGGSSSSSSSSSSSTDANLIDSKLTNPITNAVETGKWKNVDGRWYYYDVQGNMLVGWQLINGKWFFFNKEGIMQIGWLNDNGVWYYLEPTPGTELGVMKTGWQLVNGNWYYLNPVEGIGLGAMKTGWINSNGTWYYLNSSGAMLTGWYNDTDSNWYYLNSSGAMVTGWFNDADGKWYYLNSNGSMAYDTTIDGYYLNNSGVWE